MLILSNCPKLIDWADKEETNQINICKTIEYIAKIGSAKQKRMDGEII